MSLCKVVSILCLYVRWSLMSLYYVFRDARLMAPDVDKTLHDIVMEMGKLDQSAATEYLKRMRSRGRYSCDVWS